MAINTNLGVDKKLIDIKIKKNISRGVGGGSETIYTIKSNT